jgi:hypothetical protein
VRPCSNAARKTQGSWYSTLRAGACGAPDEPAWCAWRVIEEVRIASAPLHAFWSQCHKVARF